MTALEIRAELMRVGKTMRSIARDLKVTPNTVLYVIHRKGVSARVMDAIAEAINKPKEEIFPEYFNRPRKVVNG